MIAPINPMIHSPILITINRIIERPFVSEGKPCLKKILILGFNFDCRYLNLNALVSFYNDLKNYLQNPKLLE